MAEGAADRHRDPMPRQIGVVADFAAREHVVTHHKEERAGPGVEYVRGHGELDEYPALQGVKERCGEPRERDVNLPGGQELYVLDSGAASHQLYRDSGLAEVPAVDGEVQRCLGHDPADAHAHADMRTPDRVAWNLWVGCGLTRWRRRVSGTGGQAARRAAGHGSQCRAGTSRRVPKQLSTTPPRHAATSRLARSGSPRPSAASSG